MHIKDEVTARIAKANVAFGRLRANVWERNGIKLDTKLEVYKGVVLPTLLYACETWAVYQLHAKKLNHFHLICLGKLLKIKWQDKIPDTVVLKKSGMQSMHTVLKLAQLRWTGHVITMPDERLPKNMDNYKRESALKVATRNATKTPSKPLLRISSYQFGLGKSLHRSDHINKGAALYKKKRICEAERKRRQRKANTNRPTAVSMTLICSTCNRQFRARIGPVSHQKTHQRTRTYSRTSWLLEEAKFWASLVYVK